MKDKEKQIEEIAREMSKELCCYYDKQKRKCSNCFGMEEDCDLHCNFGRTLKRLSNAGYRKITDSVVLSKEELNEIINQTKETEKNYYKRVVIPQERKEMAEKFLQLAYDRSLEKSFIKKVEELAKSLGAEIKE